MKALIARFKHEVVSFWQNEVPRSWDAFWFHVDAPERLVLFQRAFAACFSIYMMGWCLYADQWLIESAFHLTVDIYNPVYPTPFPPLPDAWLYPFVALLILAPWLLIVNRGPPLFMRAAKFLCFGLAVYVQLVDQPSSFTLNKLFIIFFFLLAIAPAPVRLPDGRLVRSAWPVRVVQVTLMIQYATAGICKVFWGDWLLRTDVLFTHSVGLYRTEVAYWVIAMTPMWGWAIIQFLALAFEAFAPLIFIPKKTRVFAIVSGIIFHMVIAVLMKDLIFFSLQMCVFYVLFLPVPWVVKTEQKLAGWGLGAAR